VIGSEYDKKNFKYMYESKIMKPIKIVKMGMGDKKE
jgi:hypothetical protein